MLAGLVGLASMSVEMWGTAIAQTPAAKAENEPDGAAGYARTLSKAFRDAAKKVLPSVVMIQHTASAVESEDNEGEGFDNSPENPFGDMMPPEFRQFFKQFPRMPRRGMPMPHGGGEASVGSGVIIDKSGIILTNNHVVAGGGKLKVRLHDGREFEATDVKTDPKTDLAVIRLKGADNLSAVKLGNSDDAQVGDWVLALGDPFGLEGTVTAGIISAKGRGLGIAARENFIQTDAAINPGNSGGPLVNLDGDVVGINTAISSRSGGNQGVGFAVSANLAKWVSRQLIAQGIVKRAYLGVAIQPVSQDLAKQFGVEARQGAVIADVQPNTPAAAAGLKTGDVIVEFNGKPVGNPQQLQEAVEQSTIGEKAGLTVMRDGKRTALNVTVKEQPADYGLAGGKSAGSSSEGSTREDKLGVEVANLTPEIAEKLGVNSDQGVVITDVRKGSPAASVGLESGMVITQVGQKTIKSTDEFRAAMERQSLAKGIMLLVRSAQGARFVVIQKS
jgi:serine protease Do